MSETTSGAIRDGLVAADVVGSKVFLDEAPANTVPPYVTYNEIVSASPGLRGDARTTMMEVRKQYNLWQKAEEEDLDLLPMLLSALDGMIVKTSSHDFSGVVKAETVTRIEEPLDSELVHHEITVAVMQPLTTF